MNLMDFDIGNIVYIIIAVVYVINKVRKALPKSNDNNKSQSNKAPVSILKKEKPTTSKDDLSQSVNNFFSDLMENPEKKIAEFVEGKVEKPLPIEEVNPAEYETDIIGDNHLSLETETREHQLEGIKKKRQKNVIEENQIVDIVEDEFEFDLEDAIVYDAVMNKPYE